MIAVGQKKEKSEKRKLLFGTDLIFSREILTGESKSTFFIETPPTTNNSHRAPRVPLGGRCCDDGP